MSSIKASLIGVPLPLCSCGVLPAAMSLKRDGASRGAVTSFLISTPQTGVDSVAVTWGLLGLPVALAKVVAAFAAGVIGGTLADRFGRPAETDAGPAGCAERDEGHFLSRMWDYSVRTIFRDIYGWVAAGIMVSALMTMILEPGQLAGDPILRGPAGLLAALVLGIPLYVCSVASVPIAAGLVYAGFPVGSSLVFLMAGPATNAATMGAVRKTLGSRVFLIYVLTVVIVSLAVGLLLNSIQLPSAATSAHSSHGAGGAEGVPAAAASAVVAAGILWFALKDIRRFLSGIHGKLRGGAGRMSMRARIRISGMTCSGCERRIRAALATVPGIEVVRVSAVEGMAEISLADSGRGRLEDALEAVREAGYEAEEEQNGDGIEW
ncbi:MAG: hypothetical protein AVO35_03035 [Candidatus Aegiribacteria sp. MLS_C]|nr:MAG: hypothetical protein AVO35_03035 [Candidatus Aegiribacteria sp. MLS_C]